jgi:anthranilate phosphoribosyltransferase
VSSGEPTHAAFPAVFARIEAGAITPDEVRGAFEAIFAGAWTPVQIGAFAGAMRIRGETSDAIGAAAGVLREVMAAVDHDLPEVIDTCGTGGDGAHTINVSTAAAIVLAAGGAHRAQHGNRAVSSQCGSADVVDALGIPIDLPPAKHGAILREARITFLMAPAHHPALRHAAQARRELGIRTIFNALGPLVNPARATHQLVGVYDDALRPVLARALGRLGSRRAWVVRSEDGLDEVSPEAPTRVSVLAEDGSVTERVIRPEDFGAAKVPIGQLAGGDAAHNAAAIEAILRGEDHPARSAVLVHAGAALAVLRRSDDLRACHDDAKDAIDSGRARATLEAWRRVAATAKGGA